MNIVLEMYTGNKKSVSLLKLFSVMLWVAFRFGVFTVF